MSKIDVEWEKIKTELMNENYNDFFNIFKKILEETLGYAGEILNKEDIKLLKYNLYTLDGLYIIDIHKFIEKVIFLIMLLIKMEGVVLIIIDIIKYQENC